MNIDSVLIKCCVEILVKDKTALVLQACKMLHILYSLLSFSARAKKHSPLTEDAPQAAEFVLVKQANTLINHFGSKGRHFCYNEAARPTYRYTYQGKIFKDAK